MASTLPPSRWSSDTLPELLGRVIDLLHRPDDRARFSAVCRSWRSGALQHHRHAPPPPFILHADGTFVTLPDRRFHRGLSFPSDTSFVGATGVWLLLYRTDADATGRSRRSYLLYNPFSQTTVPLPALDAVIGEADEEWFEVRKVLMRSTPDGDVVVVSTNSSNYPIILCRPGKCGAWCPKPREMHYLCIIDVAFFGDRLYGVTRNEDLVLLDLGEGDDGMPIITSAKYVISSNTQTAENDEEEYGHEEEEDNDDEDEYASSLEEEEDGSSDNGDMSGTEEETDDDASSLEQEDDNSGNGDMSGTEEETDGEYHDDASSLEQEDDNSDNGDMSETDGAEYDSESSLDEGDDNRGMSETEEEDDAEYDASSLDEHEELEYPIDTTSPCQVEQRQICKGEDPDVHGGYIVTTRRLLESNGKLLMVRRQERVPPKSKSYRLNVEVTEANMDLATWVPAAAHGINEQLFVGERFSKSIASNARNGEKFVCHFEDEDDVLDKTSQSIDEMCGSKSTWIFPPV